MGEPITEPELNARFAEFRRSAQTDALMLLESAKQGMTLAVKDALASERELTDAKLDGVREKIGGVEKWVKWGALGIAVNAAAVTTTALLTRTGPTEAVHTTLEALSRLL